MAWNAGQLLRLLGVVTLFMTSLTPAASSAEALTIIGVEIADRVRVEGVDQELWLRGHAKLDRNMLPWYALVLHGDRRVRRREAWGEALEPCRLTLVWMENSAPQADVRAYFAELFERTIPAANYPQMAAQIDDFVGTLPPARRGQRWRFDYWPDGGMRFFVDDVEQRRISGFDLNKAILGLWLGSAADNTVRALLTERVR